MAKEKKKGEPMFQEDWVMRQIRYAIQFIARMLFNKDVITYDIQDIYHPTETDMLYSRINSLIDQGRINEAENLLFETLDTYNTNHLIIALDFYSRINEMSDAELEVSSFSREEIESGLNDIKAQFGISI